MAEHPSIIPTMRYRDAKAAIDWLCRAFGFEQHLVIPGEGGSIAHAELTYRNGMTMVGSARDDDFGKQLWWTRLCTPQASARPESRRNSTTGWRSRVDSNRRCREKPFRRKRAQELEIFRVEIGWHPSENEFAFSSVRFSSLTLNSGAARTRLGCETSPEELRSSKMRAAAVSRNARRFARSDRLYHQLFHLSLPRFFAFPQRKGLGVRSAGQ